MPAHSRRVERPWLLFFGMGIATALVIVGLGVGWSVFSSRAAQPVPEESRPSVGVEEAAAPEDLPSLPQTGAAADESSAAALSTAQSREGMQAAGRSESGGSGDGGESVPEGRQSGTRSADVGPSLQQEPASQAPVAQPPASPSAQGAGVRLEAGRTYSKRVRSADGAEARLGGIVYSESQPIALINGLVVAPGDMVAGFTVIAIELKRVELEVDGVRFYLSQD